MEGVTEETLALFRKAQTTGLTEATGAYSYDLTGLVRQIPIVTPLRDLLPRVKSSDGNPNCVWRAFMNINNQQPSPLPGYDAGAAAMLYSEQDFQTPYVPVGLSTSITQDSFDLAQGLYDPFAEGSFQLLNQILLGEDKALAGAQNYALPVPGTVTWSTATTGGSIASGATTYIGVAPRTGYNYFFGGNGQGNSAHANVGTTTSTNTATGSIAAVKGATAYDWFQSANGSTWYYYSTTTVATVTMTTTITASQAVSNLVDLSTALPTYNASADNGSFTTGSPNGLISSLTGAYLNSGGAYTTPGAGSSTVNPAQFTDGGAAALTLSGGSVSQIVTMFQNIYNSVKCSPTAIMMNGLQAQEIANLILAANSATTYLQTDESGRVDVVAGGRVGSVINAIANTTVPIEVHPSLPPGTIVFRTDRVPFPQANVSNTLEVRTLRDYSMFDYGVTRSTSTGGGPRKEFEIRSMEAFVNRMPSAMGVLTNIA